MSLRINAERRTSILRALASNKPAPKAQAMFKSFSFRLAEMLTTAALAAIVLTAWQADRRDRAQLAADLAAAKQSLAQTDARQHDRDAQLAKTLATLAAGKRSVTSPTQIIRDLPNQISLPAPISLQATSQPCDKTFLECGGLAAALTAEAKHQLPTTTTEPSTGAKASTAPAQAILPTADLKPLYDFAVDCKACQSKLAAAQADLTDERAKTAILTRERNEAVRVAKGGSLLQRIRRNAKWLLIGVAAGAIAAKAHP